MQCPRVFTRVTASSAAIAVLFAAVATASPGAFAGILDSEVNADFDEFSIPDHRWRSSSVALSGQGWSNSNERETEIWRTSHYAGECRGYFAWRRDSDRRAHAITVSGGPGIDRDHERSSYRPDPAVGRTDDWTKRRRTTRVDENWQLALSAREYPRWVDPVGIQVSVDFGGRYSRRSTKERHDEREQFLDGRFRHVLRDIREKGWNYDHGIDASAQLGIGRIRDATGVYQARLLEDRLRRDGRLTSPFSSEVRHALARLFYLSPGFNAAYSAVHDLPEKAFWRDVERILVESGALADHRFDAYDLLHAAERIVTASGRIQRYKGTFVGPVLRSESGHSHERTDDGRRRQEFLDGSLVSDTGNSNSERRTYSRDVVSAGIRGAWHRPIGLRTQLDIVTSALGDVDGLDVERTWFTDADLRYLVGERWCFSLAAEYGIVAREDVENFRGWRAAASSQLRYYLEDRLSFEARIDVSHESVHGELRSRSSNFQIGMSYDRGRMWAPGLIDPVVPVN